MKTSPSKDSQVDFRNLRVLPSGFQVAIMRQGYAISKHFAGHNSRQRSLKRMPKPHQMVRIQRNHVRDGEKQHDGEKGAKTT